MPKRVGNIYHKIYNLNNLRKAHHHASKNKSGYAMVRQVNENPEFYIKEIQKLLKTETYKPSPYKIEIIQDRNKERELFKLPYYPDRIIQWAILLKTEHIFMDNFMFHTCASIKDRGIDRAFRMCRRYMRLSDYETQFCLKIDIKKFYPNINKDILKYQLARKFKDKRLLNLFNIIIDSYPREKGIPIGSYLSQFLANFYLSELDHYLKEQLQLKYVIRYMDDMVIFHYDKNHLQRTLQHIKEFVDISLDLELKDNYQIFPSNVRGVDFVGYRVFKNYILIRKSTATNIKNTFKHIRKTSQKSITYKDFCAANSYLGVVVRANHFRLYNKYVLPAIDKLVRYYTQNINSNPNKIIKYRRTLYRKQMVIKK